MSEKEIKSGTEISKKEKLNVAILTLIVAILNLIFFFYIWFQFTILDYVCIIGIGVLAVAPSYIANGTMPFTGGRWPIDHGKTLFDGERIFGDGKTIDGLVGGFVIGTIAGFALSFLNYPIYIFAVKTEVLPYSAIPWSFYLKLVTPDEVYAVLGYTLWRENFDLAYIFRIPLLAIGAPIGDLIGSFFKRRLKIKRGAQFPVVDQLDFVLMSVAFAYPLFPLRLHYILIICLLTPLIALLGNVVAYKLHRKSVPW